MADEPDYSVLPLQERLVHKVRLGAYGEISGIFSSSGGEDDICFSKYSGDQWKKIVLDSNVAAQEAGIDALVNFLKYGGTQTGTAVRPYVVAGLVEKGMVSNRAGTKVKSAEALLLLVELEGADGVISDFVPLLKHRLPKIVIGAGSAMYEIVQNFGAQIARPELVLPQLAKLFAHADKKVRTEAQKISVEMYKYVGGQFEALVFSDLKPIQQKELLALFEQEAVGTTIPPRLLRSQQGNVGGAELEEATPVDDVAMVDPEESEQDAFDRMPSMDVLSKIPGDLASKVSSTKWKERKAALEEIQPLFKAMKFQNDDYTELLRVLAKCLKDVNIMVVQLAAEIGNSLAQGLRYSFARYVSIVFAVTLERTKEKKPTVLDPLLTFLATMFVYSGFEGVLDETVLVLAANKVPKVKEESYKYLTQCIVESKNQPSKDQIEMIMKAGIKGVNDTQGLVRNFAQQMIGTLMKLVGERPLNSYLGKIEDLKIKKILEYCEQAEVKQKRTQVAPMVKSQAAPQRVSLPVVKAAPVSNDNKLVKKKLAPGSMPTKREASSPLKRTDTRLRNGPKSSRLTTMLVNKPLVSKLENIGTFDNQELQQLRAERQVWLREKLDFENKQEKFEKEKEHMTEEIKSLKNRVSELLDEFTKTNLKIKSKDTQLTRLKVDYEKSQATVHELEKNLTGQRQPMRLSMGGARNDGGSKIGGSKLYNGGLKRYSLPVYKQEPSRNKDAQSDINAGVGSLTIEEKENSGVNKRESLKLEAMDEADEEFNVVTSRLRERIAKMRNRSREGHP